MLILGAYENTLSYHPNKPQMYFARSEYGKYISNKRTLKALKGCHCKNVVSEIIIFI